MKLTVKDVNVAVVDEALDQDKFIQFWNYFNELEFAYRSSTAWQKVWRLNDGQVLSSISSYHSKAPFNSPMDWIDQTVSGLAAQYLEDIIGKKGVDWNDIQYTPYIYPSGTKISWHNDVGYNGACIFYPHQEWSPYWGGELFLARTPSEKESQEIMLSNQKGSLNDTMNREFISPLLNAYGMGSYISPIPNRMTFTSSSVWHSVNRVDQAAGDKLRCSVVAFFLKDKII